LADFLDVGEVVFDGAKVWGIRRQKKDMMAVPMSDGFQVFLFVESGVVKDNRGVWPQGFAKHLVEPAVDKSRVRGTREQQRCKKILAATRGDQACPWTAMTGMIAVHFLAARAPAVAAAYIGIEARFIGIGDIPATALGDDAAQFLQVSYPFFRIAFLVLQRLFLCVSFICFIATWMALM
jgi:hypothetical protein